MTKKRRDTFVRSLPLGDLTDPLVKKKTRILRYYQMRTRGTPDRWDWTSDSKIMTLLGYRSKQNFHRDRKALIEAKRLLVEEVPADQLRWDSGKLRYRYNEEAEAHLSEEQIAIWNEIQGSRSKFVFVSDLADEPEAPSLDISTKAEKGWVPEVYWPEAKDIGDLRSPHWMALAELEGRIPWLMSFEPEAQTFWGTKLRLSSGDNPILRNIVDEDLRSQVALLGLAEWVKRSGIQDGLDKKRRPVTARLLAAALREYVTQTEVFGRAVEMCIPDEEDVLHDMAVLSRGHQTVRDILSQSPEEAEVEEVRIAS